MYYDYKNKTLDLTCVKMAQEKTKLVERNKRAIEYSRQCEQRNKAKLENISNYIIDGIIIITLGFICFCLMTV